MRAGGGTPGNAASDHVLAALSNAAFNEGRGGTPGNATPSCAVSVSPRHVQ